MEDTIKEARKSFDYRIESKKRDFALLAMELVRLGVSVSDLAEILAQACGGSDGK